MAARYPNVHTSPNLVLAHRQVHIVAASVKPGIGTLIVIEDFTAISGQETDIHRCM